MLKRCVVVVVGEEDWWSSVVGSNQDRLLVQSTLRRSGWSGKWTVLKSGSLRGDGCKDGK